MTFYVSSKILTLPLYFLLALLYFGSVHQSIAGSGGGGERGGGAGSGAGGGGGGCGGNSPTSTAAQGAGATRGRSSSSLWLLLHVLLGFLILCSAAGVAQGAGRLEGPNPQDTQPHRCPNLPHAHSCPSFPPRSSPLAALRVCACHCYNMYMYMYMHMFLSLRRDQRSARWPRQLRERLNAVPVLQLLRHLPYTQLAGVRVGAVP